MHFSQFGILFYLLTPASGIAVRPYPRAVSSSAPSGTRIVALAAVPTPPPGAAGPGQNGSALWQTAQCDQYGIDDATIAFGDRWVAADVPGAWNALLDEWKRGSRDGMYRGLAFPEFTSYYFHGPEHWNCKDVGSVPCSTVVQCKDVNHPAGYLLLNAFSGIHQLHSEMHSALNTAMIEIQSKIGEFSSIFAPQSDDTKIILAIFDSLTTLMGFSVSAFFSVVEKDVANAAQSIASSRGSISGESFHTAKETTDWLKGPVHEFDGRAYANDMTYQLYGITAAWTRNNAPTVHDKLGAQNSLSSALGDLFAAWKDIEVSYLQTIFSGDDSSQNNLQALIGDGKMNFVPNRLDQNDMAAELEAVLYGQLMPKAWKTASDGAGAHPFILKTDFSCDNKAASIPEIHDYQIMTDADSASTRACWRDKLVFLVNANEWDFFNQVHFTPLPGADSNNLSGGKWGGITIDDIVASAMTGYEDAGYKNGYKSPGMDEIEKDSNADKYGKRVRYPGFFNIPVCEGLARTKGQIMANHHATSQFWPCDAPEGLNVKGTTIHVNRGWITANGKTPVCDTFTVDDPGYGDTLSATLYGRFDGENTSEATVKAKCKITFSWPKWWGDIYYGADDCMYDGESKPIPDADGNPVCCKEDDSLTDMVTNPYVVGGACKPH